MEQFLKTEAILGHLSVTDMSYDTKYTENSQTMSLINATSPFPVGKVLYPPNNFTSFSGVDRDQRRAMWGYIRRISACPNWEPFTDYVIIPNTPYPNNTNTHKHFYFANSTKPKEQERLSKFAAKRKSNIYDSHLQDMKVIHFASVPGQGFRMLIQFYNMLYFEDIHMDRLYKRFVR